MRTAITVFCLAAFSAPVWAAGPAPKTPADWADLAAAKIPSIADAVERATDLVWLAKTYADANQPKQAAKYLAKAVDYATTQNEGRPLAKLLVGVAGVQAELKDRAACRETLQRAEAVVSSLPRSRDEFIDRWADITVLYLQIGDEKAAANIASKDQNKSQWIMNLRARAYSLMNRHQWAVALQVLKLAEDNAGKDTSFQEQIKRTKAFALASRGDWTAAQETAGKIKTGAARMWVLVDVATEARKAGKKKLAGGLVAQAVKVLDSLLKTKMNRGRESLGLVAFYVQAQLWDKAADVIRKLPPGLDKAAGWTQLIVAEVNAGKTRAAKAALREAEKSYNAWPSTEPSNAPPDRVRIGGGDMAAEYALTGELDKALKIYAQMGENKPWVRDGIADGAAVGGHAPALIKWTSTMAPADAAEVYLIVAGVLTRQAQAKTQAASKSKSSAEAKPAATTRPAGKGKPKHVGKAKS